MGTNVLFLCFGANSLLSVGGPDLVMSLDNLMYYAYDKWGTVGLRLFVSLGLGPFCVFGYFYVYLPMAVNALLQ